MTSYRTLIYNNFSWLFFDKLFHLIVGLFVTVWVARYLGPENYGIFNYAVAYTAFFSLFVNFGFANIIIREVVKYPNKTNIYLGTAFCLKLIGAAISISLIVISLIVYQFDHIVKVTILLVAVGFIFQSFDVIDFYYQSLMLSKYVVFARNLSFILSSFFKIFLIINDYSVTYFALAFSIDILLSALFLIIVYKITGKKLNKWRFDRKIAGDLLRDSWPLAANIFLVSIHIRIDQVMIKSMLDLEQTGIFSVAVKISEYWYFIPGILVQTLMPYFVKLRQINHSFYENRLMQLYSIMFWMGFLIGIITILFGKSLILILFGVEYLGAYQALVYNIWKGIFISQAVARGIWIINENVQRYRIIVNVLAVLTNIILNIYLISYMGISGAALSSLISIGISTWLYALFVKPLRSSTFAMIKSISPIYLFRRNCESIL